MEVLLVVAVLVLLASCCTGVQMINSARSTYSSSRSPQKRCCGDDLGEGGYAYDDARTPTAERVSGGTQAGRYDSKEIICDDFVDKNGNNLFDSGSDDEIDNDCDNKANCQDTESTDSPNCIGKAGPRGSYCCGAASQCLSETSKLFESVIDGVGCDTGSTKECYCSEITKGIVDDTLSDSKTNHYRVLDKDEIKTCLASEASGREDRFILINDLEDGEEYRFEIESETTLNEDPNGGCAGGTSFFIYKDGITKASGVTYLDRLEFYSGEKVVVSFRNTRTFDCIVKIKITKV